MILDDFISIDTETTGTFPYTGDRAFLVSIASGKHEYHFYEEDFPSLEELRLNEYGGMVFMQNAKFDMAFLEKLGITLAKATIIDLMVLARLSDNTRPSLKLDDIANEFGLQKLDAVKAYVKKQKLYSYRQLPGISKKQKVFHYDKVPREIMTPYACNDAQITLTLSKTLFPSYFDSWMKVLNDEVKLTRVLYDMEKRGILLDTDYMLASIRSLNLQINTAKNEFQEKTGHKFVDSRKVFSKIFKSGNVSYKFTEKGNAKFDEETLASWDHPIAKIILSIRNASKRVETFENLFFFCDGAGYIHPNLNQTGATTGRMSVRNPPMQCIEKVEDPSPEDILLRRVFIPRPKYLYFMLDYDQFEYRKMLNYAKQMDLIEQVQAGVDVHVATAQLLGITRKQAKTVNFGLLYGIGIDELAKMLGVSSLEARYIKANYFAKLPKIAKFIRDTMERARETNIITNAFGRRYIFEGQSDCYKAPNYLIQGECADYIKKAMINIHDFLKDFKSSMLLQIHDELLFEIYETETYLIPHLQKLMCSVPLGREQYLEYTCGVDYSRTNWQDKEPWKI